MSILCMLGLHSFTGGTRYTLTYGGHICDQSCHDRSTFILVVKRCARCDRRVAMKKDMDGCAYLTKSVDIDIADEMIERYERECTTMALKEL